MAVNYEPLNRELASIVSPVFPTSFGDIYDQYKEKHGRASIGQLATALTGKVPASKSGFAKGSEGYKTAAREYGSARRQIERHVTGQYKEFAPGAQAKLKEIGQTLNPIRKDVPGQGVTLTIKFKAPGEKAHAPRTREATIEISGPELFDFVNQPGQPQYADLFDLWFDDGGNAYGEDGDYEVDVVDVY